MGQEAPLTDLQYYVFECGVTVAEVAERIGTTSTKILEELNATPVPSWWRSRQPQTVT